MHVGTGSRTLKYLEDLKSKKVAAGAVLEGEDFEEGVNTFSKEDAQLGYMSCVTRNEAQGGMKKVECQETLKRVELVYCNTMRVPSTSGGPSTITCSDIEDFLRYEQHRLCINREYVENNMKVENNYYPDVVE